MRIKVLSGGRKSIELPLSDAELNFQMKRIGIEETVPVCRLVEASEKDNPLCKFEGQTVNMDEVNFFAKRMDCLTAFPASCENTITLIERIVVNAVIRIGRILVFPVTISAVLLSSP